MSALDTHAIHSALAPGRILKWKWRRSPASHSRKVPLLKMAKIFRQPGNPKKLNPIELDLFHTAVWPVFVVAQCFAIMPLKNVASPHPFRVRFVWNSVGSILTGVFLFVGFLMVLSVSSESIRGGINGNNFVGIVFFSCGLCACTLFLRLALRWPQLIRYWTKVELTFLTPPYEPTQRTLKSKIRLSACIIAALFLVEHGMYFASDIYSYRMQKNLCNITQPPLSYEDYMKQHFTFIFSHIPYHILTTFPVLYLNGTFTFIWNYMDLFIVLISLGLATRFQQIGQRAEIISSTNVSQNTWHTIRCHYMQLCDLLEEVDEQMSSIILLSSMNNLYFICYQILSIFNKLRWSINYIYFWYSLLYLIGRTGFVFLCASKINDESKVPLRALRSVPAEGWGDEAERFSVHITEDCVALSGRKLFFITRKLLFGMAATVVTYELVLLQFDELRAGKPLADLCI